MEEKQYKKNAVLVVVMLVFLTACATGMVGRYFELSDVDNISKGDSKAKVLSVLGKPYATAHDQNEGAWNYSYGSILGAQSVTINFTDDKVTQVTKKCNGNKTC